MPEGKTVCISRYVNRQKGQKSTRIQLVLAAQYRCVFAQQSQAVSAFFELFFLRKC